MKIRKKVILFFWNNLPLQIWTLKCSLNSLTLQFCRYDVSVLRYSSSEFGHLYVQASVEGIMFHKHQI